jgi:beta-glucanase (GH16 family)
VLAATAASAAELPAASAYPPPDYQLVWSDEFNGDSLETAKWAYRTDSKCWSAQRPENVSVAGGSLRITLKKERCGDKDYTGGGVISKRAFKYGYYEARLRFPAPAKGSHSAFWLMKHDGSGSAEWSRKGNWAQEFDVAEHCSARPDLYVTGVHDWTHKTKPGIAIGFRSVNAPGADICKDFHAYGCEFTPAEVKFCFDGKVVNALPAADFPHGELNIWLTYLATEYAGGTMDDGRLPASIEVDWVRVYEEKPRR